jgi:hypothetical protein
MIRVRGSFVAVLGLLLPVCSPKPDGATGAESAPPVATAPAAASSPASSSAAPTASVSVDEGGPVANDPAEHAVLLAIAGSYGAFARADGTHWSALDCSAPPDDTSHVSVAAAGSPHGRKLYTLRIFDFDAYTKDTKQKPPPADAHRLAKGAPVPGTEQVLVKVSYLPTDDRDKAAWGVASATFEGKTFYPGELRDLFVMYKPTDKSKKTDGGWLYGTVSPDRKKVTSAGLVKSCMGCHEDAPHGRLFGARP